MSEPQNYIQTQAQIPNNWDDAYLERAFHIVDEIQGSPDISMVRVGSPVKAHHSSGIPESCEAGIYTSPVASKLDSFNSKSFSSSSVLELDSSDIACGVSTAYIKSEQRANQTKGESAASFQSQEKVKKCTFKLRTKCLI